MLSIEKLHHSTTATFSWCMVNYQKHINSQRHYLRDAFILWIKPLEKSTQDDDDVYQKEIKNHHELPEETKSIFFMNDCDSMPFYENQEGVYRDLEMLKAFWGVGKPTESPESPDSTPTSSTTTTIEGVWPIQSTPPTSLCLAPWKKCRLSDDTRRLCGQVKCCQNIFAE